MILSLLPFSRSARTRHTPISAFQHQTRREKKTSKKQTRNPPKVSRRQIRFEPLEAIQDGSRWFLPAGTKVKHGTTSNNLATIMQHGLVGGHEQGRSRLRATTELDPLVSDGVYVASCYAAYGSCMYNFGASFAALTPSKIKRFGHVMRMFLASMPFFGSKQKLQHALLQPVIDKYVNPDKALIAACGIPVVLNITLQENVLIKADEDYVPTAKPSEKALFKLAGNVWSVYGSTAILQTVPADWIESVEHFDTSHKSAISAFELHLLDMNDEEILDDAIQQFHLRNLLFEQAQNQALTKDQFNNDLLNAVLATWLCQRKPQEARRMWFDQVVSPRQSVHNFSGLCSVEEVPVFLNHLEQNNKRELLACGYQLFYEYAAEARKVGLRAVST